MANKYEKRGEIVEFEPGDYCTIRVPKKDRPSGATTMRILVRVLRRHGHTYELQTKYGILKSKYGAQNLNRIDQCTAEEDGKELGDSRCKITLRYAAHTLARARGGGYTAVVQAIVAQLAVCATKTASDVLSTVIGALASVPAKRQVRATPR